MRIALNTITTKQQSGGGFQIACNFIRATLIYDTSGVEWFYFVSEDINKAIGDLFKEKINNIYFVFPTQPDFKNTYKAVKRQLAVLEQRLDLDLIYTITSPCYFSFKTLEVMRFANAWVTNPNNYAWASLSIKQRLRMKMYCYIQRRLLKKVKFIVTQSETVKKGLYRITGLPSDHIVVIPNVLPQAFLESDVSPIRKSNYIEVACVAAGYPHKNLIIVPAVISELQEKYGLSNVRFHLTLPKDSSIWRKIEKDLSKFGLSDRVVNHGILKQDKLVDLYRRCEICFLPTLLETFSACSLEAMHFGLFVVASDFDFNREIIQDAGLYFEPANPQDAAERINSIIGSNELRELLSNKMKERMTFYSDYKMYFSLTVEVLRMFGKAAQGY